MAAENVKVIVRCRPMNSREKNMNCRTVVAMSGCSQVQLTNPTDYNCPPKQFTFDSVYDTQSNTEALYNDICYPLIESVLEGYNATVFAYGQTGCGKSFTMEGAPQFNIKPETPSNNPVQVLSVENMPSENSINTPGRKESVSGSERGIIPRAFEHIFEAIAVAADVKYLALVSYLEIYNEQIRDLLMPSDKQNSSMSGLSLKEIPNEGVVIQGLSTHPVHNIQECEHLLKIGSKNRMIGATLMNQSSSRSHSIFTISVEQIAKNNCISQTALECDTDKDQIKKGKLNLVDLAGSERQAKTGATGDRLKEATKINLSLSALGNVISALVDGKSKHIPYRDSKLTRLLQDSLGGNTRTLMIACVSPADNNYDETLSTLRYANRAKNIHNKPTINEDPKDAMLRQYQEEIQKLRQLLEINNVNPGSPEKIEKLSDGVIPQILPKTEEHRKELDVEKNRLISEFKHEMEKLKNAHENEKTAKEHLIQEMHQLKSQYEVNLNKINTQINKSAEAKKVSKEEILKRLQALKSSMIGGEKANDEKLKEKRKRKKLAAEKKLSALAHVLARVEQEEDREMLQDQYKDISQELTLKTEGLRKYRHKVKVLEREISDIQGEFETERTDYLETIRRLEKTIKLLSQITERMAPQMKKDCNYNDLDVIKSQSVWIDDLQKWKIPEVIISRTKLPPAGKGWSTSSNSSSSGTSNSGPSTPTSPDYHYHIATSSNTNHLAKSEKENVTGNYFKPRRATQLLNTANHTDPSKAFNTWRDFTHRHKQDAPATAVNYGTTSPIMSGTIALSSSWNEFNTPISNSTLTNLWINGYGVTSPEMNMRRPMRLDALPNIDKRHKTKLNSMDLI